MGRTLMFVTPGMPAQCWHLFLYPWRLAHCGRYCLHQPASRFGSFVHILRIEPCIKSSTGIVSMLRVYAGVSYRVFGDNNGSDNEE